jgi:hypothetical protein
LRTPIKTLGTYDIKAKLFEGVEATFKVKVDMSEKQAEEFKKKQAAAEKKAAAKKAELQLKLLKKKLQKKQLKHNSIEGGELPHFFQSIRISLWNRDQDKSYLMIYLLNEQLLEVYSLIIRPLTK